MTDDSLDQPQVPPRAAAAAPARPRFEIRITRGLVLGFGGLVLLAVALVLGLGLWSATKNTFDLLHEQAEAMIEIMVASVAQHLEPAEAQLRHLGAQLESGAIDISNDDDIGKYLSGALAATPHIRSVVFIHEDARMVFALRRDDGVILQVVDISQMPVIREGLEGGRERSGVFWAEVIHPETSEYTLLNVRRPVRKDGEYLGLLASTVRVDRLSHLLDEAASSFGGFAFVLYDERYVLAHRRMVSDFSLFQGENPLPTIAEVGDPVITAFFQPGEALDSEVEFFAEVGAHGVTVAGEEYVLLSRSIDRFGDEPWIVGVYLPAGDVEDEFLRLQWAAYAGLVVLVIALIVAYAFARYLSAPIHRFADAAHNVRDLSLGRVQQLPQSMFTEISDAAQAFNSMVVGLRWFETYVPRNLVHKLVQQGDEAVQASVSRESTVIFTDIFAFTKQSETMTAPETAAFLNEHFAVLSHCIEAEDGTIDKFIGDAIMAFWGAPDAQPDHAARACRAALAIRDEVRASNAERVAAGQEPVRVRIGLHSGEVVVGNIGAPGRINYTIVGDTVNIANRLEQMGKEIGGEDEEVIILLSGATAEAAGGAVAAVPAGTHAIRGRTGDIEVFKL